MATTRILPAHASDEVAVGLGLAFAVHAIPAVMVALTLAGYVQLRTTEHAVVRPPVVAAELLKLGDEARVFELPDRKAPPLPTKLPQDPVASENASNEPPPRRDAGVVPRNAKEEDLLARFAERAEAFAEKNAPAAVASVDAGAPGAMGVAGSSRGSSIGTQTDPSKARGGSIYAAQLREFFKSQWSLPSFLDPSDRAKFSAKYSITFDDSMHIVSVSEQPVQSSGNDVFDDSARSMLLRLRDSHANLPQPPEEEAATFRGKTIVIKLQP